MSRTHKFLAVAGVVILAAGVGSLIWVVSSQAERASAAAAPVATGTAPAALMSMWEAQGIRVIAADVDQISPVSVTVKIPESDLRPPDGLFVTHELLRQAALFGAAGTDLWRLVIVNVGETGEESLHLRVRAADLMPAGGPGAASPMEESQLRVALQRIVDDAAQHAGMSLDPIQLATEVDSRSVELRGRSVASKAGGFVDQVYAQVAALNRAQGSQVAVLTIRIDDLQGDAVLREIDDFQLAEGWRASWTASGAPGATPEWVN